MVAHEVSELNTLVESYLNGEIHDIDLSSLVTSNAKERFSVHAATRLIHAFDLYRSKACSVNDVLGPLRNYLLSQQTSLELNRINIPKDNSFGIYFDKFTSRYHASFAFPSYVNERFVRDVFLLESDGRSEDIQGLDLNTNAFIRNLTGFTSFKSAAQKIAVSGALKTPNGFTTLVSLPTGGGKSLVTQSLSYQSDGLTIVIVPTVSLALDQVRVCKSLLKHRNVDEEVFSYSGGDDLAPITEAMKNRTARIIFTSPEAAMLNSSIRQSLDSAAKSRYLKNIVIDEAHIVVDWGTLFRVDFQCLECWRKDLLKLNPDIRTMLLSATFDDHAVDVLKSLFSTDEEKWIEIRCDALRREPRFVHVKVNSYTEKNEKLVELIRKMPHPLIAYVDNPGEAKRVEALLKKADIENVKTFTGKTSSKKRRELIDEWTKDEFEIMIATSAFGVGVDKPDVRTVLHLYVPPDPNAYYQELGRGGRDRLPCLSIMCVSTEDRKSTRGRVVKRVLTTDKIVARWRSMVFSPSTKFKKDNVIVDTSVLPSYVEEDYYEDGPISQGHSNWNIYVLLFLRRHSLIEIRDIVPQGSNYMFIVRIKDEILLSGSKDDQFERLEPLRVEELADYRDSFATISDALNHSSRDCWSEMFYDTYRYVLEYCAGCNEHEDVVDYSSGRFPLKNKLKASMSQLDKEQLSLFSGAKEAVVFSDNDHICALLRSLERYRISTFVSTDLQKTAVYVDSLGDNPSLMVLDVGFAKRLLDKGGLMFFSGVLAVKYDGTPKETYDLYRYFTRSLGKHENMRLLHIAYEDCRFEWLDKRLSDLVDGPVLSYLTLA